MTAVRSPAAQRRVTAAVLLLPAFALITVFLLVPVARNVQLSLQRWDGFGEAEYVGLRNFAEAFSDERLWNALSNTVIFAVTTTIGTLGVGYLLAAAVYSKVAGAAFFRFVYFIPVMVPLTMTAVLWRLFLDPTQGPVNRSLVAIGITSPPQWLADPNLALGITIAATIWQYAGFPMVIFLAAMDRIPPEILEAARLDGVTWWQQLRYMLLPLTSRVVVVMTTLFLIGGLKVFDIIYVMTSGGPGQSTNVLGLFLYSQAFQWLRFGYAAAIGVIATVLITGCSIIYLRLVTRDEGV